MKQKNTLIFGGLAILIAVVLGALGAHYLKETLSYPSEKIESWKTGVQYQLIHGLALIIMVLVQKTFNAIDLKRSILFLKIGTLLFSGSIYLLTLNFSIGSSILPKIMGPLTPFGGLFLITGWVFFIISVLKVKIENE